MKLVVKLIIAFLLCGLLLFIGFILYGMWFFKTMEKGEVLTQEVNTTIPFYWSDSGHMLVDVSINNQQYPFLLDSGASTMVFDNLLETQSLPFIGKGMGMGTGGGWFFPSIYRVDQLSINGIQLSGVSVENIERIPMSCLEDVYGILGKEVMRHFVWQIDFEQEQMQVVTQKDQLSFRENAEEIIVEEGRGSDTISSRLMVDLGSSGGINASLKKLDKLTSRRLLILGASSIGLDGESNRKSAFQEVDSFKVGNILIPEFYAFGSEQSMGLMGVGFLKNFRTTLSWKDNLLILEPYENQDFSIDGFGFLPRYDAEEEAVVIKAIYEGLPAQQAGVAIGAKVLSVNNLPMQTKEQFCSFHFKGIDSIQLKIEYSGEIQSYELNRVAYFPEEQ